MEILGREADEVDSLTSDDIYLNRTDRTELIEHLNRDGYHEYEYRLKRKDGTPILVRGRSIVITDDNGQPVRYQGYMEDITELKQMQQQLIRTQRLRAVGELAAGVSHNLNNILVGVLLPAQMLKRSLVDPQQLRVIDDILASAQTARDVVRRLNLSVRGEDDDILQSVPIAEVVQEVKRATQFRWKDEAQAQGLSIEIVSALEDVPPIQATRAGLHDVLVNLLFNAVEALPEGGTIALRARRDKDQVLLTVSDTGIGMEGAVQQRVFEPFFTTKGTVDSGLGLSTAYGIVTGWGGAIAVASAPGEGTTFTLSLPIWTGAVVAGEQVVQKKERDEGR